MTKKNKPISLRTLEHLAGKTDKLHRKTYGRSHRYLVIILSILFNYAMFLFMLIYLAIKTNWSYTFQRLAYTLTNNHLQGGDGNSNTGLASMNLWYFIIMTIITISLLFYCIFKWTTSENDFYHPYLFERKFNLYIIMFLVITPATIGLGKDIFFSIIDVNKLPTDTFSPTDTDLSKLATDMKNSLLNFGHYNELYWILASPMVWCLWLWAKGMNTYHPESDKWKFIRWIWNGFVWLWHKLIPIFSFGRLH